MNNITTKQIAELRKETGAGVMDCKEALRETNGDTKKALEILKKKGADRAKKRQDRKTVQGVVESYIHNGARVGALVDLRSETDFVAKTDEFKDAAKKIAMQVTSMEPKNVGELLSQPLIFDEKKKVKDLIDELSAKTGEKIELKRFERFEVGE